MDNGDDIGTKTEEEKKESDKKARISRGGIVKARKDSRWPLLFPDGSKIDASTTLGVFNIVCDAATSIVITYELSPLELELALREGGSCLFLFAEDPATASYNRGLTPWLRTNGNYQKVTYLLAMGLHKAGRKSIENYFEPGCRDIGENLSRLSNAGFAVLDENIKGQWFNFFRNNKHGELAVKSEKMHDEIKKWIKEDKKFRKAYRSSGVVLIKEY
jgi:hypothetical protein